MITETDGAEVAATFGLGDAVMFEGPVARGVLGQIWQLVTVEGRWAVKESFGIETDDDPEEVALFQEAAGRAGVPVPAIRRTPKGALSATVRGDPVRVYGWVDLREPDIGIDVAPVGLVLARIHRVEFGGESPAHPWYETPVGAPRWDELIDELRSAHSQLADDFARWREEFVALEGWLAPPGARQTCHRDLWADNLRETASGELCVIDWDNAGLADRNQELAMVLFEFASGDADRARRLVESYSDAGGPGRVRRRGDFSMAIASLLHIAEHIGRQWLAADATAADRDRAVGRFAEYDSHPFTRSIIDELLDAVA